MKILKKYTSSDGMMSLINRISLSAGLDFKEARNFQLRKLQDIAKSVYFKGSIHIEVVNCKDFGRIGKMLSSKASVFRHLKRDGYDLIKTHYFTIESNLPKHKVTFSNYNETINFSVLIIKSIMEIKGENSKI
jgi:hypothetical protein